MKILHYTLGLPPYRSGGLTKYTNDLMKEQVQNGDEVFLLFPGQITLGSKKSTIKKYKIVEKIKVYELINPLPVPLMKGINIPTEFMQSCDYLFYKNFLYSIKIDVINIHTLMGLHKEFLIAARELNIPIIYTTHDYFGLCLKVNFLDSNSTICENRNPIKCSNCNVTGDSLVKIKILQSREYRWIKNYGMIDKVKVFKSYIKPYREIEDINENRDLAKVNHHAHEYELLLKYYKEMFLLIDRFIFNSEIAKDIYCNYIGSDIKGDIVSITHKDIADNRRNKKFNLQKDLKLTYLGPDKSYKGFDLLLTSMKMLEARGYTNIKLNVYGDTSCFGMLRQNIKVNGRYVYSDLDKIFEQTDLLIVPSKWYETFGFITLEAISYGVPVLVSNKVGSKDILKGNFNKGIIIQDTCEEIVETLISIYEDREMLEKINFNILNDEFNMTLTRHYEELKIIYNKILKENKLC